MGLLAARNGYDRVVNDKELLEGENKWLTPLRAVVEIM
jgi:hypothetical protein